MNHPRFRLALSTIALVVLVFLVPAITGSGAPPAGPLPVPPPNYVYLPLVAKPAPTPVCPTSSSNMYIGGPAQQVELDEVVRWAPEHADKNLDWRGYTLNTDANFRRELVNFGTDDPNEPPQLATLFRPYRVPTLSSFYKVYDWLWATSPNPGTRGDPLTYPDYPYQVTALGLETRPGESLYVPVSSDYGIGQGMQVIVVFADEDTVAFRYGREDGYAPPGYPGCYGYTVHVDNICTDPNLLRLYNRLDNPDGALGPDGPRYVHKSLSERPYWYDLPNLPNTASFGTARDTEIMVAVVDSGMFMDPRSCNEWWQYRPGYTGSCPSWN